MTLMNDLLLDCLHSSVLPQQLLLKILNFILLNIGLILNFLILLAQTLVLEDCYLKLFLELFHFLSEAKSLLESHIVLAH